MDGQPIEEPKKYTLGDILPKYTLGDILETEEDREDMAEAVQEEEAEIDRRLEVLYTYVGRQLTYPERRAVLEIVEKNSIKDDKGYIVTYSSFVLAWKILRATAQ